MTAIDPVVDADLNAYVDGELDVSRRITVEAYLADHPETAAKVMADLSIRGELRLALAGETSAGRAETRDAARRLERGLAYGRALNSLQRFAAVAMLVGAGWVAHTTLGPFTVAEVSASVPPPLYVENAVQAYRATETRDRIASQAKTTVYNADDIRAATAIVMPSLPKGWSVADVEIYPSDFGPSVALTLDARGERLSLFAVRPGSFSVEPVSHVALDGVQASYWQIGEVAYSLISASTAANLDAEARQLSRTLY